MKLLGFLTGMILIGGLGAWYMHETALPRSDSPAPEFDFKTLDTPEKSKPAREAPAQEHPPAAESPPLERPTLQLPSPPTRGSEETAPASTRPLPELTAPSDPAEPPQAGPSWQAFWKPFQTELSAQGFAQRLRETTGLEIKVDKKSANQYRVLFPYTSEEERQHHIELIEDRTSLKLKLSGPP